MFGLSKCERKPIAREKHPMRVWNCVNQAGDLASTSMPACLGRSHSYDGQTICSRDIYAVDSQCLSVSLSYE